MAAPDRVYKLVEHFDANREQFRRPDYNETLVRVNFINPLFEELGWDVRNTSGEAPSERADLVNRMLALHEQRQAARTALDTRTLTNQIEADRPADRPAGLRAVRADRRRDRHRRGGDGAVGACVDHVQRSVATGETPVKRW